MADMTPLADILNGDDASATPVQNNFQIIEAYINGTNLIRTDGTEVMAADLDLGGYRIVNADLSNIVPSGTVFDYAGTSVPTGWLACDGSVVLQATYPDLYAAIGTTWNTGGEAGTEFRLPDFSERMTVGPGASPFAAVGDTGGLADAIIPNHTHTGNYVLSPGTSGQWTASSGSTQITYTSPSGGAVGGESVTDKNYPPYAVVTKMIKT